MTYLTVRKIQGEPLLYWRNNTGAGYVRGRWVSWGLRGSTDILCCYRGRMVGIECKASNGEQSEVQKTFQYNLEKAGGVYVIAKTIDNVRQTFEAIENEDKRRKNS